MVVVAGASTTTQILLWLINSSPCAADIHLCTSCLGHAFLPADLLLL
jgi:hypothetical protein